MIKITQTLRRLAPIYNLSILAAVMVLAHEVCVMKEGCHQMSALLEQVSPVQAATETAKLRPGVRLLETR